MKDFTKNSITEFKDVNKRFGYSIEDFDCDLDVICASLSYVEIDSDKPRCTINIYDYELLDSIIDVFAEISQRMKREAN